MHKLIPVYRSLFPSGSNGKLIFVLRVFALRAVLEKRIKHLNRGIPVFYFVTPNMTDYANTLTHPSGILYGRSLIVKLSGGFR
jgi:hypothetical protein